MSTLGVINGRVEQRNVRVHPEFTPSLLSEKSLETDPHALLAKETLESHLENPLQIKAWEDASRPCLPPASFITLLDRGTLDSPSNPLLYEDWRATGPKDPQNHQSHEMTKKRQNVRHEVAEAIVERINRGDPQWGQRLRRSAMTRHRAHALATTPAAARGSSRRVAATPLLGSEDETPEGHEVGQPLRRNCFSKPITDLSGINEQMSVEQYEAVRADLSCAMDHNVRRCCWEELECIAHLCRNCPVVFKAQIARMNCISDLFKFLDQQFLPEFTDKDEEKWQTLLIGHGQRIPEFMIELRTIAYRLGKSDAEQGACFTKALRSEYPELSMNLRIDHPHLPLMSLVSKAKQWVELRGPAKKHESSQATINDDENLVGTPCPNPERKHQEPLPEMLPWVPGYVERVDSTRRYASFLPHRGSERAHVIPHKSSPELAAMVPQLRKGERIWYRAVRDNMGMHVIQMRTT